ncbi:MAG: hypothetical protein C4545_05770 [Anaerolineaceae bacterium]|jgi:hypothetical protein|nr:MAG: hypothetical protein C4545_05770 [Anaerolineaceae bacterium]
MNEIRIGYVLNADTLGCTAGCPTSQTSNPEFGEMVKIPAQNDHIIYGIITNVHILDDGLIRQLATTNPIEERIIRDNRDNRIIPLEFSIIFLGYSRQQHISHLLPPSPPLSLESTYPCSNEEILTFTTAGNGGYLRYMVADKGTLNFDLVAAHFRNMHALLAGEEREAWVEKSTRTLVHFYRNDYDTLSRLLHTLSDTAVFTE